MLQKRIVSLRGERYSWAMTVSENIHQVKCESFRLASATEEGRNALLRAIAEGLVRDWDEIEEANRADLDAAGAEGIAPSILSRVKFDREKRDGVIRGIESVVSLPDPIGKTLEKRELDEGLVLTRKSVPLGVIGMVFEARPDALVQIVSLCVKSGNAIVLKGGREASRTNRALAASIKRSASGSPVGSGWILLLENHEDVDAMLRAEGDIDLIIPRGSNSFVRFVMTHTTIPVLGHAAGICHVYVDREADITKAVDIAYDSKTQYPAACNAAETILVHKDIAPSFIPPLMAKFREKGVVVHGDEAVRAIDRGKDIIPVAEGSWDTEYLAQEVNIGVVGSAREAIDHINRHGSHHTDAVVTESRETAALFENRVDSADVFVNASTRFADGYRFGLGAEVGISTGKIHARGPVGLSGLMTSKWLLEGSGQIVASYMGPHARKFTHKELV